VQSTSSFLWGRKKSGPQSIGVSRGGLNTKIHAVCDALGNPLRFKLTPGNLSDVGEAPKLIEGLSAKALLADKGYDSNSVVELALAGGMEAIIASRRNRKLPRPLDSTRYFARHLVENLFQRMKIFRRIATRFEKLDERFLGFIYIAGIMKWIH
jgi:transposase